jgi:serine/threonine protein kinase
VLVFPPSVLIYVFFLSCFLFLLLFLFLFLFFFASDGPQGKTVVMHNFKPSRDLLKELIGDQKLSDGERKKVAQLHDLLEKMLHMDPDKRINPRDAIEHPFITEPLEM